MQAATPRIRIYGADWCGMTTRALRHLDDLEVDYEYIDVEGDPEASQWVKDQNQGKECKPTYRIDDEVFTYPTQEQVEAILRQKGIL